MKRIYAIQQNVRIYKKRRSRYPWANMDIGDSFYIPKSVNPVPCGLLSYANKKYGAKYACRVEPHGQGSRIWRIK